MHLIKKPKKRSLYFIVVGILIALILAGIFLAKRTEINEESLDSDTNDLKTKFLLLSEAGTNLCAGPNVVEQINSDRLQGSCCSPMDFHRYAEQIDGLKKFSYISEIQKDPYDISSEWAEKYINYFQTTKLTQEQQQIYDEAMMLSDEGGPCCCKCWRWYAYGGLAEYLIVEYNFSAKQIAELWELSDGCGGPGHENT